MVTKRSIGDQGEVIALQYLQSKGYEILQTNYSISGGEIDIIALEGDITVFVEVRKRKNDFLAHPLDTFSRSKRMALKRALMTYCNKKKLDFSKIRVDFVGIMDQPDGVGHRIYHIRGVEIE